jgi:hypothetical protein
MDEDLDRLAQQYSLRRNIKLGERLGFGIHGTVFTAEDNTKPGFFAVKFHREKRPCERECRVYQRLREEQITRILGFNVPQLLRFDEEIPRDGDDDCPFALSSRFCGRSSRSSS